jgi:regulator of protease activity HflC (stomatin/prohibitin superfamily)
MAVLIVVIVIVLFALVVAARTIRVIPQARAGVVERLGRYSRTLEPGLTIVTPFIDRVRPLVDLREQVVNFSPQSVITEDNVVVGIETVLYFTITDPRSATYEIANPLQAIEQLTVTTLRNVIGGLTLEATLTSRENVNAELRTVLDEATGKWGIRVSRVEIKSVDPPADIKAAMEKQMRAEREKRAAILTAEGLRQAAILTADGEKQSKILRAEGDKQSSILRAEGEAQAIGHVFQSIHQNDPDPKLLAYQYLQTLPQLAQGAGNTFWVIPSEVTTALKAVTSAFGGKPDEESAAGSSRAAGAAAGTAHPVGQSEAPAGAVGSEAAPAALAAAGIAVPGQLNVGNGVAAPPVPGEVGPGSGQERDQDSDQH